MSRLPKDYLLHILQEITYILGDTEGLTKEVFLQDERLKRAIVRSLEIIGEATKNLPDDFRDQHPQVSWKRMAGMRDKLIHEYFGVDYDIVWDVIENHIPYLHHEIKILIDNQ